MNTKLMTAINKSVTPSHALMQPHSIRMSAVLAGLVLCSVSTLTQASEPQLTAPAYTLKIVTHGEAPSGSHNMDEQARQDNRRADVAIRTKVQTGTRLETVETTEEVEVKVSDGANRSIRLDDGGVIWVSKDPASLTPTLNVTSSNSITVEEGELLNPINFEISTNYAHYINQWELNVYDVNDTDETKPLVTFMGSDLSTGRAIKWSGKFKDGKKVKAGDELKYVLKVKDKAGHVDETNARQISFTGPQRNIKDDDEVKTVVSSKLESNLARQTIPIHGSRVRIFGRDIATGNQLTINDEKIDLVDNKFVIEKLLPDGQHEFDIAVTDNDQKTYHNPLSVELEGKYLFMVGLADVTIGEGKVTGNLESLSDGDKHLDGDIFVDGRLAFYLKGKIKGKYLVTAQMDTGTEAIDEIFDDIHKKDPESIFRRLDPDKYYPVYGDDSTIIDDTDSQGKMFVRVDWDKSRALWGNYNTDLTGTELSSFNRSLYGAKLNHKSTKTTASGDHKTDITVFGSEAQSAFRHNQFLGTGGSLYYLKDKDIVDGSEKVWIEVRASEDSDRAVETIVLEEGQDYQIDDFQGRIILNRPLLQIAGIEGSIIKDTPLDGNQVYLMVDYEYVPDDFDSDKASYGARGKVWGNDHIALGATYVHEDRIDDDYDLKGVDITLKKAKGTYLKAEYAESEARQTQGSFLSDDGGLNFDAFAESSDDVGDKEGSAYSLEARVNIQEFSRKHGSIGAWFKKRDAGFSTSRYDNSEDTVDAGVEAIVKVNDKVDLSSRASILDKEDTLKTTTASAQVDFKTTNKLTLSAEARYVEEQDQSTNANTADSLTGKGAHAALKVGYDVKPNVNVYAVAQATVKTSGNYEDNNLFSVGTKAKLTDKLELDAELSTGDRGDAATVGASYRMMDNYTLYSNFTHSTDRTDGRRKAFTVGQGVTVSDQLKVYTEHQYTHEDTQSGVGHTFGLDYQLTKELTASASVQTAELDKDDGGLTDRDAFSVGLTYKKDKTDASTRLEYRRDKGSEEDTEQWVTTNKVNYRLNPSLRLQGKFNYSETKDKLGNTRDASFTEAALGFALRPVHNDRLNILGRLTYLYDLQPLSQSVNPDEKSLIASIESSYQLNKKWEIGGKLAHKEGQIRTDRDSGQWEKNDATLAATRVRYHLTNKWDAMGEYHWMNSKESKDIQHGAMISVDRHVGKNMKVGVGYNFTDFTDDLSDTNGTAKGWFINLIGKY